MRHVPASGCARFPLPLIGLLVSSGVLLGGISPLFAQPSGANSYSDCQPPAKSEYLLLVVSETPESQAQVKQVLPANTRSTVCTYLNQVVTRVSGFTSLDTANSWAQYMNDIVGLRAVVAQPAAGGVAASPPLPPGRSTAAYDPRPLGTGYAVLVNYFNQPDIALQVQQSLGQPVGLAVYGQRPYLLAVHTSSQEDANSMVQTLKSQGFTTLVVDSRQVVLLRSAVSE